MNVFWDPMPDGNVEHIAEHDLTMEDVEHVLANPESEDFSRAITSSVSGQAVLIWLHA